MRVCQGLISEGIEPITLEESEWLKQRAKRNRRHIFIFVVSTAIYFVAFIVVATASFGVNLLSSLLMIALLVVPVLSLKSRTEIRAFASVRCQTVEVFAVPLPEVEFESRQAVPDDDEDDRPEIMPPFRRIVPTGEVIQRDGERFSEPTYERVVECPPDSAPVPSARRMLTTLELAELRGRQWRDQVRGGISVVISLAVSLGLLKDGFGSSNLSFFGGAVIALGGIVGLIYGLSGCFDGVAANDIRDGHAYANGREEKLASGRLWRFDGVPALDRWRRVRD